MGRLREVGWDRITRPFFDCTLARPFQGGGQTVRLLARYRPGEQTNDKVARRQFRENLPETRTHAPLHAIAVHRTRQLALADDHAQARMAGLIRPCHHQKMVDAGALAVGKNPVEFGRGGQPCIPESDGFRPDCLRDDQTARRARPLARRALITARPALVFMRARKPWVRLRRTVEGW